MAQLVAGDRFHPNKSRTFENMQRSFRVDYLDSASLKGFIAADFVHVSMQGYPHDVLRPFLLTSDCSGVSSPCTPSLDA